MGDTFTRAMIFTRNLLLLALLAGAPVAAPADVTYAARVDRKNDVYVDVANVTRSGIRVTSLVVAFYDRRKTVIEKSTIECRNDCRVGRADVESFGPIESPRVWDTVKVMDVYYEAEAEEEGGQGDRTRARGEVVCPLRPESPGADAERVRSAGFRRRPARIA